MSFAEDKIQNQLDTPEITIQIPEKRVLEGHQVPISHPEEEPELSASVVEHLKEGLVILERLDKKLTEIFNPKHHSSEEVTKRFLKLSNGLKLLQIHFEFLLELINAPSEEDFPEIIKKFNVLNRHYRPITKKTDICLPSITMIFENVIYSLLSEIEKATDKLSITKEDGSVEIKGDRKTIRHGQIMASKLETALEYFPEAATLLPDDIFAQARTSETWTNLYKGCEIITLADKATVKKRYKPVYTMFKVANAILYKSEKKPDNKSFKEMCSVVLSGLSYGTKQEKAEFKASLYLSEPKMESAFQVWNFIEKRWVQKLIGLTLPTMDYDKKIYVHRLFPAITKETILREYETGTLNKITPSTFKPIDLTAKKDLILESIFKKQADAVKMRIISPFPIVLKGINSEKARAMAMKTINTVNRLLTKGKSQGDEPDGIIFHIHGGGFVSGSSSSHRIYLYKWAKSLKKIIISVDYRLAPDYAYPAPLDDVWQAYNWVVNYAEPLLGIKTNKIVLAGDSAGGNLCMALTLRAIKMGIRVPDGCLLAYPALNIDPCKYVPSYFLALEDSVLPYSLLKLCTKAYAKEFRTDIDPYLSPVTAQDELLEKLPPIKILTGTDDPLHDDNWRFLQNMQRLNKDIKMIIYEHMPHGFFSFDQIEDYKKVLDGTCKNLAELFGQKESELASPDQENVESSRMKTEAVQTPKEKKQMFSGILDIFKPNQGQSQRTATGQLKETTEGINT